MGTYIKKAIVVEFVGPPGAGKTTNSYCFSEALKSIGLQVFLNDELEDYVVGLNRYHKLYLIYKTCVQKGHLLLLYVIILLRNGIFNLKSFTRYASLALRETALKHLTETKLVDVVLLDQWAIQGLWSSTIFNVEPTSSFTKKLKYLYLKTDIVIYFDVDIATASERMELRSTFNSRFDEMGLKQRNEELTKYKEYLFQLFTISSCKNKYVLSTLQSPVENTRYFIKILNKYRHERNNYK